MGNKPPHLANYLYYANHKESWEQGDVAYGAIAAEHAMRSPEKLMPCGVRDRDVGKGQEQEHGGKSERENNRKPRNR